MIDRKICASLVGISTALVVSCRPREAGPPARVQRVVLVTIDTARADHFGFDGYPRAVTPEIDRLARDGVVFTRHFTPMPLTEPAHASIFTGLPPRSHGLLRNGQRIAINGDRNLATWFHDRGFRTAAIVSRVGLRPSTLGLPGFDDQISPGPARLTFRAGETLKMSRSWLGKHRKDPFFLWVHFWDPHFPYEPLPEDRIFEKGGPQFSPRIPNNFIPASFSLTPGMLEREVDRYDEEIHAVDRAVGALVREVAAGCPADDSPLVVLTADHGEELTELFAEDRYAFGHGKFLYPEELRVPLVFWSPGRIPPGRWPGLSDHTLLAARIRRLALGRSPWIGRALPFLVAQRTAYEKLPVASLDGESYSVQTTRGQAVFWQNRPDEWFASAEDRAEPAGPHLAEMATLLEKWRRATPVASGSAEPADPERLRWLRSLGYLR